MSHHPNYMAIFWWLLALTIVEVAAGIMHAPPGALQTFKVATLVLLALAKASLVAMYFMHLRFERRTLALIAGTPLVLCVMLLLMLLPDAAASHSGSAAAPAAAATPGAASPEALPAPPEPAADHGSAAQPDPGAP